MAGGILVVVIGRVSSTTSIRLGKFMFGWFGIFTGGVFLSLSVYVGGVVGWVKSVVPSLLPPES
jgi:hypothetical protein